MEGVKTLRLIGLPILLMLISCGEREYHVSLDVNAPLGEGICFTGRSISERACLPGRQKGCPTVGCTAKPESISDICEQLRSEYASSGRVLYGTFPIVRYNHKPLIRENGHWWPTQWVNNIKLREVCYEGIDLSWRARKSILRRDEANEKHSY